MPLVLPIEVYELLENKLGKQEAKEIGHVIVRSMETIEEKAKEQVLLKKIEIKEELRNELVTRELFEERFKRLEQNELVTRELFEERFKRLEQRVNFMILLMVLALTLMNPIVADIIKGLMR